jgi:hypothetical protein
MDEDHPFSQWVRQRPPEVQKLMIDWPPGATVRAKPGEHLMAPAPAVEGRVASWFEDGTIGVEAPMQDTRTSPITGITVHSGETIRGQCNPGQLELVGYATFGETQITPELIRSIIDGAE